MKTPIAPMQHPTMTDHHRVPVIYVDNKYEIYVGENHIRIYEEDELPNIIKSRLAMVKANVTNVDPPDYMSYAKAYDPPSEHLSGIGWQPCEGLYVVVIPTKDLTYIMKSVYNESPSSKLMYRCFFMGTFIANDRPTFRTLEEYQDWLLHPKAKSKEE